MYTTLSAPLIHFLEHNRARLLALWQYSGSAGCSACPILVGA